MTTYYAEDRLTILHGDAADLHLPDASVDLIVTSPPYFGLRSYKDGGEHYDGQVGDEATPAEFVAALLRCTREWMRVLKPEGSIWVNLGDKYAGSVAVRSKSLLGIPWRYALACIDDLGLILRAEVIWSKPNGLPESVTDRVRRSHEQWFHFTLQPRYFSAVDHIREAHAEVSLKRAMPHRANVGRAHEGTHEIAMTKACNPLGKLPGSVWEIATQPLRVPDDLGIDHFAAFPMEWPRRIIQGWSPSGVCVACSEGRRPLVERSRQANLVSGRTDLHRGPGSQANNPTAPKAGVWVNGAPPTDVTITGEVCACLEPTAATTPAVVLDPFGGTGTTALVAYMLGRHGISNDLSRDYCRLAKWRTTDPAERARAIHQPKPEPLPEGQLALIEGATA